MKDDDERVTAPKPDGSGDGRHLTGIVHETPQTENTETNEQIEAVKNETEDIVWAFMHEYNRSQVQRSSPGSENQRVRHSGTQTDELAEIEQVVQPSTERVAVTEFSDIRMRDETHAQFARNMVRIADDMEATYRPTVITMVNRWLLALHRERNGPVTIDSVWAAFKRVIENVLSSGITWGKLLVLLLFAYEIAVALYVEGVPQFVRSLITSFVQYLIDSPAIRWIARNGGWAVAATALWMQMVKAQLMAWAPYIAYVIGVSALAVGSFLFSKRK